jgi:DNA-binding GntR family transcriptional regulator
MSIAPPQNGSLRDQAYNRLRRLLILQQVREGERLRESHWAAKLSVNRTALREAFARLEAEGFVTKGPKTGYFVPALTSEDMREILDVRIILEGGAIERIIADGQNTSTHLKGMRIACEQLERLVKEEYMLGVAEADRRYHESLIDAAGNKRLMTLYQRAPLPILHPEVISGHSWEVRVQKTLNEHRTILDAILRGSADEAKAQLRTHLHERATIPLHAG